jgi:hypothetical protein
MKKLLLILLLASGMQQLKAQQLSLAMPDIKLTDSLKNYFKPKPYNPLQQLRVQPNIFVAPIANGIIYDHMPIAKLQSADHMPVVKPGEDGMKYTMLIKKIPSAPPADAVPVPAPQ